MASGCFIVSKLKSDPRDIWFSIESEDIPSEQALLKADVEAALKVLRRSFPIGDTRFDQYFEELLALAQAGLVGDFANPKVATQSLDSLKEKVLSDQSLKLKNEYSIKLLKSALWFSIPSLVVAFFVWLFRNQNQDYWPTIVSFALLWSATFLGAWIVYAAKPAITDFDLLPRLEQDQTSPTLRLVFTGLIAMVFGFLLYLKIIVINLGPISSDQIGSKPLVGLLFGIVAGFSEQALVSLTLNTLVIPSSKGKKGKT
ncbi:MAG TPA: hypothetical protein VK171_04295 [Fimbriimonas sp.]|nr:hypothetical protein [Fimbriimonas sp.]